VIRSLPFKRFFPSSLRHRVLRSRPQARELRSLALLFAPPHQIGNFYSFGLSRLTSELRQLDFFRSSATAPRGFPPGSFPRLCVLPVPHFGFGFFLLGPRRLGPPNLLLVLRLNAKRTSDSTLFLDGILSGFLLPSGNPEPLRIFLYLLGSHSGEGSPCLLRY